MTRPSFSLLPWSQSTDWPAYAAVAQRAEALGYDTVWTWDHLYAIFGDPYQPIFEGYTVLAAWAAKTERIKLGLMVGANPFRNPGLVAKSIVTIDHISNGRAICGMGGAWAGFEAEAYGIEFGSGFGERLDWMDESVGIIRALLDGDSVTHDGPRYRTKELVARPRPIQAHLPIMIGGSGEKKTLRTLAKYGDQWNAFGTPEVLAHKRAVLERHCADVGRDPAAIHKTVGCKIVIRDSEAEARRDWLSLLEANKMTLEEGLEDESWMFGSPEAIAELLAAYRPIGFDGFMVEEPAPYDPETIERLMTEVAPAVE
jgi:alkanesulfonate monooxygenase SsuD/methylene tetrahydromethanopterin reductase-like flavin-dependent oxidoreductase (luciferase family)